MTSNQYVIDSSSLIELNRINPIDIYPTVWKNMESSIRKGNLLAPQEVHYEVIERDDQVSNWIKSRNDLFREPTEKQIEILKDMLKDYPSLVQQSRRYDADGWVIALAKELETSSQQTLIPVKRIVVTEEKIRGNEIKIPFVCQKYNIEAIDILDMFRIEGWTF